MILFDVNVLVSAHKQGAQDHRRYRAAVEREVAGPGPFGVSDLVLSGFLRVVTHPRIFAPPSEIADALRVCEELRARPNCMVVAPGPRHWEIFAALCGQLRARGNDVPDVFLAALAIESGCELLTADRGFTRFPGLRWRHPLD